MSSVFRLISDEIITYIPNPLNKTLIKQQNYIIPKPKGKCTVVGFVSHLKGSAQTHPLVDSLIKEDIGIVYVCDKMPINAVVDPHIHYLECPNKWFIHTLFFSPLNFSSVFSSQVNGQLARAFSEFTKYYIPILNSARDVLRLSKNFDVNKNNVLVEILGGIGDHLLTIPSLKTLASKGDKVFVLCEDHRKPCFNNLSYIKGFFSKRSDVNISKFKKVIYLHFGQLLNDYRQDFNKQNRIYSVAELCGFSPVELVIDTPEIIFTKEEFALAKRKWGPYKNKIFLGYDSARIDSKMPNNMAQNLINKFKAKGHTVFVTSIRRHSFENCIDLSKKTSLRELFALIAICDCVLTVDTSFLHIAGALNKKIFCVMNYFKPDWRCGTYKNCKAYVPQVSCFPCTAKQFVGSREWQCHQKSCYEFQKWETIIKDISEFFKKGKFIIHSNNLHKRILIETTDGLGDILMTTPSAEVLYKKYGYNIDYLVSPLYKKDILENLDFIDGVYSERYSIRNNSYDLKYLLSNKLSNYGQTFCRQHRIYATAHLLNLQSDELLTSRPIINLTETETKIGQEFLSECDGKIVGISWKSDSRGRTYSLETTQKLISELTNLGYCPVILDNYGAKFDNCLNLGKKLNVRQLFSVVNACDLIITIDNGILHIAGALKKPTIFLPSTVNPAWRKYSDTVVMRSRLRCFPCDDFQRVVNFECNCKTPTCLQTISLENIIIEVNNLLETSNEN